MRLRIRVLTVATPRGAMCFEVVNTVLSHEPASQPVVVAGSRGLGHPVGSWVAPIRRAEPDEGGLA